MNIESPSADTSTTVDYSQDQGQTQSQPATQQVTSPQATPAYVTQEDLNNSYRSIQGVVTKSQQEYQQQLGNVNQTLQSLQPLVQLLQNGQNQSNQQVDPYVADPLGQLRSMAEKIQQYETTIPQLAETLQGLQAQQIGNSQSHAINEAFASDPAFAGPAGKENFERAKTLAGTVHKEQFAYLYQMAGGNAVGAFDTYLTLLKSGKLGNSPDIADLNNRFNQNAINSQKARLAALGNPQGGGYGAPANPRQTIYDVGSINF